MQDVAMAQRWVLPMWTSLAWLALALSHLLALWISNWLWIVGFLLAWWLSWVPAVVSGVALVVRLIRSGRAVVAGVVTVAMLGVGVAVHAVSWPGAFARTFYTVNEITFAEVARLEQARRLDVEGYYGGRLPLGLRHLSVNGRAASLRAMPTGDRVGVFLPQWIGIPDGGIGFAYLPNPPDHGDAFDGFGDNVYACLSLGDGWYWVTRPGGEC